MHFINLEDSIGYPRAFSQLSCQSNHGVAEGEVKKGKDMESEKLWWEVSWSSQLTQS